MELSILNLFLVLLAAWLGGQIATRLGYPAVLGELLAGILLGPPLLGVLYGSEALAVLAEIGILLMMLYIGMEIDPRELGKASKGGVLAALGGFLVPFGLGLWVVTAFGGTVIAGVFVGMAMGVTSLATKSRILVDLNILDTRIAHVMMAGALVADTLSLIIFAGIISFATAGALDIAGVGFIALKVTIFFALAWFLGLKLFPPFYSWLKQKGFTGRTFNATLVLLITLAFAELAHLAGLHGILGAFIAGLFLREAIAERKLSHELTALVKDVSLGFLAPIFFVTAGFQVSFEVFQTNLALLLTVIALATVGKILGTALFYWPTGHGWREGVVIGAGMNGRGAVEIIIAGIGLQAGIISQEIFSILVIMAIATTATVPVLLKLGVDWLKRRNELSHSSSDREGVVIAGAGAVARLLATELVKSRSVTLIDSNTQNIADARSLGLTALQGDVLDDTILRDAGIEEAGVFIGLTPNAAVNVLAAKRAHEEFLVSDVRSLLTHLSDTGLYKQLQSIGGKPLFADAVDLISWDEKVLKKQVKPLIHELTVARKDEQGIPDLSDGLPLIVHRGEHRVMFNTMAELEPGDKVFVLT